MTKICFACLEATLFEDLKIVKVNHFPDSFICGSCQEKSLDRLYRNYILSEAEANRWREQHNNKIEAAVERYKNKKWWQFWI